MWMKDIVNIPDFLWPHHSYNSINHRLYKSNMDSSFSSWLLRKLIAMKVDENVFLDYITSIIEGDETREEKMETLRSLLMETGNPVEEIDQHCSEILDEYQLVLAKNMESLSKNIAENMDEKLSRLLESSVQVENYTARTYKHTDEDIKIKEAILSQYSHLQTGEAEDGECINEPESGDDLERNTNASVIRQAEKEKRELAKLENQKKKERDKEEREKQKLTQQEKKDARRKRAQKVEHHRK